MITVKNLTNSPYDLQTVSGLVRLPAFGEVSGEFAGDYVQLLEASMAVKVIDALAARDPLDHDGDGRKGGSKPAEPAGDVLQRLRDEYAELTGSKPHHLWKEMRLQSEIDKALEA